MLVCLMTVLKHKWWNNITKNCVSTYDVRSSHEHCVTRDEGLATNHGPIDSCRGIVLLLYNSCFKTWNNAKLQRRTVWRATLLGSRRRHGWEEYQFAATSCCRSNPTSSRPPTASTRRRVKSWTSLAKWRSHVEEHLEQIVVRTNSTWPAAGGRRRNQPRRRWSLRSLRPWDRKSVV